MNHLFIYDRTPQQILTENKTFFSQSALKSIQTLAVIISSETLPFKLMSTQTSRDLHYLNK